MATSMVHDQVNKTSSAAVRNHGSSGNVLLEKKLFALLLGYFLVWCLFYLEMSQAKTCMFFFETPGRHVVKGPCARPVANCHDRHQDRC
jgi:hypothetical protein